MRTVGNNSAPYRQGPWIKRGFTLIELLVVILIILIISAVALPTVLPALAHRQVSEAARILQGALVGARDTAIHNNAPSGIRLLPDPLFNGINSNGLPDASQILAANRIVPIGPAPDYSEGYARVDLTTNYGIPTAASFLNPSTTLAYWYLSNGQWVTGTYPLGQILMVEECDFVPNMTSAQPASPTSWFWNIRIGDKMQINNSGPWYTVVGPMAVGPSGGNSELFVNVGPPGTTFGTGGISSLNRMNNTFNQYPEFLFLVNGQDDNNNGWVDEGWDGVDNNLLFEQNSKSNLMIDEPLAINSLGAGEWEAEQWLGSIFGHGVPGAPYTIQRRPTPLPNAREIALPTNVVIDLTTWGYPNASSPSLERSRLPSGMFNTFTGYVDIVINPDGTVVPTTIYSSPSSSGMGSAFVHLWLAERSDLAAPSPTLTNGAPRTTPPYLPVPLGMAPTLFPGNAELKGEYRLVTLFTRTGQISTNDTVPFDNPASPANGSTYNPGLPFTAVQQGIRGGP
jgi:prepilin-type N-terminal cleavage/methylation domain-containing protein